MLQCPAGQHAGTAACGAYMGVAAAGGRGDMAGGGRERQGAAVLKAHAHAWTCAAQATTFTHVCTKTCALR
eukprot:356157-Chlamydomonas_euryale.AAC.3